MGQRLDFGELLNRFGKIARAGNISREQLEMICDDAEEGGKHLPKSVELEAGEPPVWYWPSDGRPKSPEEQKAADERVVHAFTAMGYMSPGSRMNPSPAATEAEEPRMWYWPADGRPIVTEVDESPGRYWPAASPMRPKLQPPSRPPPPISPAASRPEPTKAPIPTWAWVLAGGTGIAGVGFGVLIGLAARYLIY